LITPDLNCCGQGGSVLLHMARRLLDSMNDDRPHKVVTGLLLFIVGVSFSAGVLAQDITGLYSNMHDDGAGVTGIEIFLVYGTGGHFATVQCAVSGTGPGRPVLVPVQVSGRRVKFRVPSEDGTLCPIGEFNGEVTAEILRGLFSGNPSSLILRRMKSYWQK
jgi:hypothetical protein